MVRKISNSISISNRLPWKIGRYGAPKKSGRALVAGRALVESRSHGISGNARIACFEMEFMQLPTLSPSSRGMIWM